MAEGALFSLATKLLTMITSPSFDKAYQRAHSIWEARNDLEDLRETIKTIQAVLLDAEKQQKDSAAVKNWIERVRDMLHDADDLFDEVNTNDMLKQQMKEGKHLKEVHVLFSKLNPVISNYSIAKKVKAIRKSLRNISNDMTLFNLVEHEYEKPINGTRRRVETGAFVDPKEVIGRDDEKEFILKFLYDKSYVERNISVVSIVGIGGMGKAALAQLVYNDAKVINDFDKRYWVCISDMYGEKEVLGRIYQSMTDQEQYHGLSLGQLQSRIREVINRNGKFLLVLEDLWEEDNARGRDLLSLLSSDGAKGSKIIITTRHSSVANAMEVDNILELNGLSNDASWELFRRFAFTEEQENIPSWIKLGKNIVKKCANVPLAIKSVASLLHTKDTMEEWKSFENEQLYKIQLSGDPIMSTLRLSYDYLPSHLKQCFAYCSLFPKDFQLCKQELIYLWMAQGYVNPKEDETLEAAGHAYFMELFRRSFFQEATEDYDGGIFSCKMHDLVHDLAQRVAREESIIMTEGMNQSHKKIRHASVVYKIDTSWNIPLPLLEADRLRSSLFMGGLTCSSHVLDQVTKFRFLRALYLKRLNIENVPCSIGGLKYLRYLNLSHNSFSHLPDSITKLVNLITLDISGCGRVAELPKDIRELISLRHLNISGCSNLWQMSPSFGKLASLQHLSDFKVGKRDRGDGKSYGLDALATLDLRGCLRIIYDDNSEWGPDELMLKCGQIPYDVEVLSIERYPSMRIPAWWSEEPALRLPKLECLVLVNCKHVKHIPPLKCLPCLRILDLIALSELEYVEEDEVVSTASFFPSLQNLTLVDLPRLEGWPRQLKPTKNPTNEEKPWFPLLSKLRIRRCPSLEYMPPAPHLQSLRISVISNEFVQQLLSPCSKPSSLQDIRIEFCTELTSFPGEGLTSLRKLEINRCSVLRNVKLAPSVLEEFTVLGCPNLELWDHREEEAWSVEWSSLGNLRLLIVENIPEAQRLPNCLQQLIALGKLQIQ